MSGMSETKEKLIDAAIKYLNSEGKEKISVKKLIKIAGVGYGTFYNHFDSVEEIQIEALNKTQYVNGNGVVGKKPVINPGEVHKYKSGCLLSSALGAMKGAYIMIDFSSTKKFNVEIPPFKLSAPFVLN